jgi:hypothetical protein
MYSVETVKNVILTITAGAAAKSDYLAELDGNRATAILVPRCRAPRRQWKHPFAPPTHRISAPC